MGIARFLHLHRFVLVVACLVVITSCGTADETTTTSTTATSTTVSTTPAPTTQPPATTVAPSTTTTTPTTTSPSTPTTTTTTTTSTTTTTTTTTTLPPPPPFVGDTKPVNGAGNGFGQLEDTRMAQHVNYDRFVLEFEENVPGYDIAYAQPPFINIPGNMVGVAGNAFLHVNLHGASTVDWDASDEHIVRSYNGPWRVTAATNNYTEAVFVTDFESDMEWILGLADRVPFRVIELDDPARLVIDVGHGDVTKAAVPMRTIDGEGDGFGWMRDSRLGGHDTFDRFVVEFRGGYRPSDDYAEPGIPGYMIHYVADPFGGCDSTDLIPVDGEVYIMVELRPAAGTDWNVDPPRVIYTGSDRLRADTKNITEAVLIGDCEGIQWVIGVEDATAFTVTWVRNPLRLVIDVPHMTSD